MVVQKHNAAVMADGNIKLFFGNRVRQLRKDRGWSQEEFAFRVGLDRSYIGGVERGERNISLENIDLIAATLQVPPSELFIGWSRDVNSSRRKQPFKRESR